MGDRVGEWKFNNKTKLLHYPKLPTKNTFKKGTLSARQEFFVFWLTERTTGYLQQHFSRIRYYVCRFLSFFLLKILSIKYFKRIKDTRIMILKLGMNPSSLVTTKTNNGPLSLSLVTHFWSKTPDFFGVFLPRMHCSPYLFLPLVLLLSLVPWIVRFTQEANRTGVHCSFCCSVNQSHDCPTIMGCFNLDKRNPNHKYKGRSSKQNPECESFTGTWIQMFWKWRVLVRLASCEEGWPNVMQQCLGGVNSS